MTQKQIYGNLGKLHGHERMKRMIKRAGGIPKQAQKCPSCGGAVVIEDDQLRDIPLCAKAYRYNIQCKHHDCLSVQGPSVAWVVMQWIKDCAEWKQQPSKTTP